MEQGILLFENARFTVITENLIRCEYSDSQSFLDDETSFAACRRYNGCEYTVRRTDESFELRTEAVRLIYRPNGKGFTAESLYGTLGGSPWHFGDTDEKNLGGTLATLDGVDGYRTVGDGVLSRSGWFVFDDSDGVPVRDGWLMLHAKRRETDLYLFSYGLDYKKALKTLFYVSGRVPLPRKYMLGSWYSRWWAYTAEELLSIVQEYDENDFPLDVMVLDMDWHHHDWKYRDNEECRHHRATYGWGHAGNLGWTGYSWNRNLIPEPRRLIEALHSRGISVTLNDHPHDGIRNHEDCYPSFMEELGLAPQSGVNLEFDAGDRRYMQAFMKSALAPLKADGVDFFWVDWQQDEIKPYLKGTRMRHIPWLNRLYYEYTREDGQRGASFSRWGGLGDQKHPIHFSGDTKSTWECLRFEVEFTAQSSNAGLMYWGHDTGGFFGERNPELYVRWTQFSAFSACLRAHSERSGQLDRRPWKWGEAETAAMRTAYHLRSRFMPYLYSLTSAVYEDGTPMIAPMYFEYPERAEAYENPQQYRLGPAVICAPVTQPCAADGFAGQQVWIPDGVYYDFFTGRAYPAGKHAFACPLAEFPLLVRGGVPVPMQPYTSRMGSAVPHELVIRLYPGETGEFTLYEDDGITEDYRTGRWLKTRLAYRREGDAAVIEIEPDGDGYEGMPQTRTYTLELVGFGKALRLDCKGEAVLDSDIHTVRLGEHPIREKLTAVLR